MSESIGTWWKWSTNPVLDNNFSSNCIVKSQPKNTHIHHNMKLSWLTWISKRQKLCLLMYDATMYTCIWPFAWRKNINRYNSSTSLTNFSSFCSPVKEKQKQWRTKGLSIVQWINLNRNNISMVAHWYPASWERKIGHILPPLVGFMAGW